MYAYNIYIYIGIYIYNSRFILTWFNIRFTWMPLEIPKHIQTPRLDPARHLDWAPRRPRSGPGRRSGRRPCRSHTTGIRRRIRSGRSARHVRPEELTTDPGCRDVLVLQNINWYGRYGRYGRYGKNRGEIIHLIHGYVGIVLINGCVNVYVHHRKSIDLSPVNHKRYSPT